MRSILHIRKKQTEPFSLDLLRLILQSTAGQATSVFTTGLSEQFLEILSQYSPLVEPDSFVSAYVDVTSSRALFGNALEIAVRISSEVRDRLDLTVSIGIAENKLLARVASAVISFPDGMGLQIPIPQDSCSSLSILDLSNGIRGSEFLAPLPISVLDSVTPKIEKRLEELGVSTVGQLAAIPERLLVRQFGPVGSLMKRQSMGEDYSPVKAAYPPEVIIIERMFDNSLVEPPEVEAYLGLMAEEALIELRRRNRLAGKVTLRLQVTTHGLSDFCTIAKDDWCEGDVFRFKKPTESPAVIVQALGKVLRRCMKPGMEISGVRIVLSDLTPGISSQLSLTGEVERKFKINRTVEHIRNRFGEKAICIASTLVPTSRARVLARIAA